MSAAAPQRRPGAAGPPPDIISSLGTSNKQQSSNVAMGAIPRYGAAQQRKGDLHESPQAGRPRMFRPASRHLCFGGEEAPSRCGLSTLIRYGSFDG